eukprot:10633567-Alexandrium_andersonii.AAC.1
MDIKTCCCDAAFAVARSGFDSPATWPTWDGVRAVSQLCLVCQGARWERALALCNASLSVV